MAYIIINFNGRGIAYILVVSWDHKEAQIMLPVFSFSGETELFNLSLNSGERLSSNGEVHELGREGSI